MAITAMSENHIELVLSIEWASFKHPWSKLSFLNEISNEHSHNFVLITDKKYHEKLAAYLCMREIIDEIHILKVAVKPIYRRKGIAYHLLNDCLEIAVQNQNRTAFLEVRPSNISGLSLYRKLGFQIIGKRPKYYIDTGEDALIMKKTL